MSGTPVQTAPGAGPAPAPPAAPVAAPLDAIDEVCSEWHGPGLRVRARKRVAADDPYMAGHFPGLPVYPGVFMIESVRQALRWGASELCRAPEVVAVASARFRAPALPGQELEIDVLVRPLGDGRHEARARITSDGGRRVADVTVVVAEGVRDA